MRAGGGGVLNGPLLTIMAATTVSVRALQQQQLQAQHLSHGHAIPIPLTPHPAGLQPPLPPGAGTASLLALSSALSHQLPLKDDRKHHDNNSIGDHPRGERRARTSVQAGGVERARGQSHGSHQCYRTVVLLLDEQQLEQLRPDSSCRYNGANKQRRQRRRAYFPFRLLTNLNFVASAEI